MGRILYGVLGDRGGHLSRGLAIAHALPQHEVLFVGGGRTAEVARHGFDHVEVPYIATELTGGKVDYTATIAGAARALSERSRAMETIKGTIGAFDPDLIITDYEYFVPRAAKALGRPTLSIDRHHVLSHCRYQRPPGHLSTRMLALSLLATLYSVADRYLVVSFAPIEARDPAKTEIFPQVIRRDLENHRPADDEHAVVYLYGARIEEIRAAFGGRKRRFVVYGQGREGEEGNLVFRHHSPDGFLADLASAAYAVSHGGHNLISEALHYRKPLLALPLGFEYEQYFNAWQLEQSGFGARGVNGRAAEALDRFEANLDVYRERLAGYRPWREMNVADRLDEMIVKGG